MDGGAKVGGADKHRCGAGSARSHLGKIDPLKPPSWLTDAAIAVGAGATATGLDTLLRKGTGITTAVGYKSVKMIELSGIIDTQAVEPRPSMESSDRLIHDLLCLVRNTDFLRLRSRALRALASLASPPSVSAAPG